MDRHNSISFPVLPSPLLVPAGSPTPACRRPAAAPPLATLLAADHPPSEKLLLHLHLSKKSLPTFLSSNLSHPPCHRHTQPPLRAAFAPTIGDADRLPMDATRGHRLTHHHLLSAAQAPLLLLVTVGSTMAATSKRLSSSPAITCTQIVTTCTSSSLLLRPNQSKLLAISTSPLPISSLFTSHCPLHHPRPHGRQPSPHLCPKPQAASPHAFIPPLEPPEPLPIAASHQSHHGQPPWAPLLPLHGQSHLLLIHSPPSLPSTMADHHLSFLLLPCQIQATGHLFSMPQSSADQATFPHLLPPPDPPVAPMEMSTIQHAAESI